MRYSPSMNGFYPEDTEYNDLPNDIIYISDDLYQQLKGCPVAMGIDGIPYLVVQENTTDGLTTAAIVKKQYLRVTADSEIAWRQDAVDAGIATEEESAALLEWKKYRVLLMRVDTTNPVWPTPPVETAS
ncbi:tail fiber assembly protein [Enterobacter hormaechei]|uniref:tail fiber assembly protein n=1 Tax=Enterobacter hormaechei TaxID=158836 RepID=UPI00403AFC58